MTPGLTRLTVFAVITAIALAVAPGASAAFEQGDAGDLRATANDFGDAAVPTIWGSFTDAEDVDMYRFCLADGASFSATTVGATTLDTQMFLFDSQGFGVYANDDWNGSRGSMLPAHHRFSPGAGGEYFLGISSYNRDPQSSLGEIFQDFFNRFQYPDGVLDANGFGAAETLIGWNGRAPGGPGLYRITLTGTTACVPPDTTPPTVDLRSPVDGAEVAQGAELVVDFSCADEGSSGLDTCVGTTASGALLDTSELGDVSVTVTARDHAGNETVVTHTVTVVDETDPVATIDSPQDGAVYDRGEHVTADYSCADEPNGSGIESCVGDVAQGADVDTSTLGEHTFTVEATDRAGNTGSKSVTYTVVDATAPDIVVTTPASGAVYGLGKHVTADYACTDEAGGSGVATCAGTVANGAPIDTSSVGEKTFRVDATDEAGNASSKSVTYTVADQAPPAITLTTPVSGAVYGLGQHVTADYTCSDDAGVATCAGTVANGAPIDTSSVGEKTFRVDATDEAGNASSKSVTYTVADQAPPAITLARPTEGAVYALGERVLASYSCQDQAGGAGVASCSGTVANGAPIDTSSFGQHTFEVKASDKAGNTASKVVTYSVAYDFKGFLWPVKNPPKVNRWKAGLPVPIRFSLHGYRGPKPEADGYPRSTRCGGGDTEVIARASKKKPMFEYLRRVDQYVMLWKTDRKWAGTCREFVLKLDDGSVHTAQFQFKKKHDRD